RPCLMLSEDKNSGKYVGVWGGDGIVTPKAGSWLHWITIDCGWLSKQGYPLSGLISVFTHEDDCDKGIVVRDGNKRLPRRVRNAAEYSPRSWLNCKRGSQGPNNTENVAIYGREAVSFPPIEAVFKYGGSAVKKWLRSLGLPKDDQWDPYWQA